MGRRNEIEIKERKPRKRVKEYIWVKNMYEGENLIAVYN